MVTPPVRVLGGPAGRGDDVLVARAAADAAGDGGADLVLGRVRVLVEQRAHGHLHPRRAEAALERVHLVEALLDGVELAVDLERLDRADLVPGGHRREDRARLHGLAVEQHDAGAAVGGVAAPVRAGQVERLADEVHEQLARLDVVRDLLAVDGHRHVHVRGLLVRRAVGRPAQRADGEHAGEMALVVDRPAAVGARRAVLGGDLRPPARTAPPTASARAAAPRRGSGGWW